MDKLKMHSMNKVDANVAQIAALFPNCVTERINEDGKLEKVVDFDMLKQELSSFVVEGNEERYQFTWPDKKKSILLANAPIAKTLRPCREESVDFDNTENLYIEGDNLDVLKLLQETYLGKIKMIYIDPPYNTGNDFVYNDDFAESTDEYLANSGQFDDEGNRLVANTESNGRYHTDWLNMLYPRLKLAKDLLTDDGVIFISIDDNEQDNLKKICDEIFGESNFIAEFFIASNSSKNNARFVSVSHEYMLCYSRNKEAISYDWKVKKNAADEFENRAKSLLNSGMSFYEIHQELLGLVKYPRFYDFDHYTYADKKGVFRTDNAGGVTKGNFETEIIHPITKKPCAKPSGGWRYKDEEIKKMIENDMFYFGEDETVIPQPKRYLHDYMYQVPKSLMFFDSQASTKWLKSEGLPFDFPKSIDLMKHIISILPSDALILDFFSGSATTAHAVMQLNAEDGGNRKFIMVQLPEETDEKSEAYKAGYKNICEIGKERIRRAGAKIKEDLKDRVVTKNSVTAVRRPKPENSIYEDNSADIMDNPILIKTVDEWKTRRPEEEYNQLVSNLDTGFRVLKLDSTNMKDVYYNPADYELSLFDNLADNIKEDRTPEDLLFQVMLDLGVLLSSKIEESTIGGKKVFNVADGFLYACFDENVTEDVITEIAKKNPYYFVMRDSSMANDSVATNFEQIFATYSPDTVRKVL